MQNKHWCPCQRQGSGQLAACSKKRELIRAAYDTRVDRAQTARPHLVELVISRPKARE